MPSISREVDYANRRRIFYKQMHLNAPKMKISFEERYFKFNRIILLAIGLWPYQQSKFARLQIVFSFGIMISNIAFQVYQYKIFELYYTFYTSNYFIHPIL